MWRLIIMLVLSHAVAFAFQPGYAADSVTVLAQAAAGPNSPGCHKEFWVLGKGTTGVKPPCPPINPVDAQIALAAAQADSVFKQPLLYVCPAKCPTLSRGAWSTKGGATCTSGKRIVVELIGGYVFECN